VRGLHYAFVLCLIGCGSGQLSQQPADGAARCAADPVESWEGHASRDNDTGYPDHVRAELAWQLVGSEGCVDRYQPSGTAHYEYAMPGALCTQTLTPADHAIAGADGELIIDRASDPPTYSGHGATAWTVTHHCTFDDGHVEETQLDGGAAWLAAAGKVEAGAITGAATLGDDAQCGPSGIPPCTYAWSFNAM
jgi:hypothetical protein